MTSQPILYSFRRCPYAIRTRIAVRAAGISYEHREVLLKDKPGELLQASPKGTVPVMVLSDRILDESLDIMRWALEQNDPNQWLAKSPGLQSAQNDWVDAFEKTFKPNLDAYKYGDRKTSEGLTEMESARERCEETLAKLEAQLQPTGKLFGKHQSFADVAAFPFIRQYSNIDPSRFRAAAHPALHRWLDGWLESAAFLEVMQKHPRWQAT